VTAAAVFSLLKTKGFTLATAESCTGGMIAAAITDIAGSSDVFDRGFVTYSNHAKIEMLGVPEPLIAAHGAVSREVAGAMALGALAHSRAEVAVSVTGIAGPGGGSVTKPVGLVHFACTRRGEKSVHAVEFFGDLGRAWVRLAARDRALELILAVLNSEPTPKN
jgi:nicotinamide-nucleotide amidase